MYLNRLIFGFIAFIVLIVLVVILLVGGGKKPTTSKTTPPMPLPSYASTDAQVIMNIDGAINGDDTHRAIRVTVDQNSRELDVIQGYSNTIIQTNTNYNTQDAYSVFLNALNLAGFTLPRKGVPANFQETGQCPLGQRINFQLTQDGDVLSNLWTTSCSNSLGTLGGNSQLLMQLFQNQITNYQTLIQDVNLN